MPAFMLSASPPGWPSRCLTRVVTDDNDVIDVAQLPSVMHAIQRALSNVPAPEREYIATALLNFAVARVLTQSQARGRCGQQPETLPDGRRPWAGSSVP